MPLISDKSDINYMIMNLSISFCSKSLIAPIERTKLIL